MSKEQLNCGEEACNKKCEQFASMNIDQLCEQINLCEKCNSGLFKQNSTAKNTYQMLSILWAECHNQMIGKLG